MRIRGRLLLVVPALLLVPVLVRLTFDEMSAFVLVGQERALALTARAIATVLHGRGDLLAAPGGPALEVHPLPLPVQIDGYAGDWGRLAELGRSFRSGPGDDQAAFRIVLGSREGSLHALVDVVDRRIVYRHPAYRRLDHCDALRLSLVGREGGLERILLLTDGPGTMSAYRVGARWRHALTGRPLAAVRAVWRETEGGYRVELRLPLELFGSGYRWRLAVVDVDDAVGRRIASVAATWPRDDSAGPLLIRSPEIERILAGLDLAGERIRIVDVGGRVRAEFGPWGPMPPIGYGAVVDAALAGREAIETRAEAGLVLAAHPLAGRDGTIGAVVVGRRPEAILSLQRRALWRMGLTGLASLVLVVVVLLLIASRLAYRIRRLSREAQAAIADDGRIVGGTIVSDRRAGDEIGDLSRTIDELLGRLGRYTRFLERMPPILRHEIDNPLNGIRMALHHLATSDREDVRRTCLATAERGVARIAAIVSALTDAASLEEALRADERRPLDLARLLRDYAASCRLQYPGHRFELEIDGTQTTILATGERIEQMLDRLVENAVDLSPAGSVVAFRLAGDGTVLRLSVENTAPPIPPERLDRLFDPLFSSRSGGADAGHLGMGLHVVRLIVESSGGRVSVANVPGMERVRFDCLWPVDGDRPVGRQR